MRTTHLGNRRLNVRLEIKVEEEKQDGDSVGDKRPLHPHGVGALEDQRLHSVADDDHKLNLHARMHGGTETRHRVNAGCQGYTCYHRTVTVIAGPCGPSQDHTGHHRNTWTMIRSCGPQQDQWAIAGLTGPIGSSRDHMSHHSTTLATTAPHGPS